MSIKTFFLISIPLIVVFAGGFLMLSPKTQPIVSNTTAPTTPPKTPPTPSPSSTSSSAVIPTPTSASASKPAPKPSPAPVKQPTAPTPITTPKPVTTPVVPKPSGITMAEVQKHSVASSCWSAIDGNAYDLTTYVTRHPGGSKQILGICGKDGTSAFEAQHGGKATPAKILAGFKKGSLAL